MSQPNKNVTLFDIFNNIFFILLSIGFVVPMLLVVIVSLTDQQSLLMNGYTFLPEKWSVDAYRYLLGSPDAVVRAYGVTVFVTVIGTIAAVLLVTMIGYSVSRPDFAYRRFIVILFLIPMFFHGGLVPTYILVTKYLHLKDTLFALILPGLVSSFHILIIKGFLTKMPYEIIESAKVDGAGEFRIFFQIIVPLSAPVMATIGLFTAFGYWNEWMNGLLYIDNPAFIPLQLLLVRVLHSIEFILASIHSTGDNSIPGQLISMKDMPGEPIRMALAVLAGGPMMFIFPFFQRYFVKGLTVGSLKG
ncbi:carbohydrate ABC transporter permease [Paenibacillus koleovorans]|uniref:carbohydrate ABC transporter permease n=1 Tax=Paenibacillus koleovorans TaxID=121608 RepID=UPI000FD6C1DC|nr:carbohydrate ABC transporter permease [Paenibacillus koleovorans]